VVIPAGAQGGGGGWYERWTGSAAANTPRVRVQVDWATVLRGSGSDSAWRLVAAGRNA